MLIEFQVENFRSFKERQVFSMVAGHFPEHRETNTFDSPLKNFEPLLRTSVIYGPNAGGKTNLLLAMKFMKDFVATSAVATALYPFNPFKLSSSNRNRASEFQIAFIQDGLRYEYGFAMGPERIENEWLVEYAHSGARSRGRALFVRAWKAKEKNYEWTYSSFLKGQRSVWAEATRPDALFLSTAIQLNSTQLRPVFDWFQKRIVVIAGEVKLNQALTLNLLDEPDGKDRLLPFLREADLGVADLKIKKEPVPATGGMVIGKQVPMMQVSPQSNSMSIVTVNLSHVADGKVPIEFDFSDESSGTQLLFNMAGAWLNVLKNGEILILDEIDAYLHPALLRYLIGHFQSATTNPNNAQLICSTHNTSILDKSMFRRDQVWFVEKNRAGASKVYPLTDFSPRNDESFERAYMRGRYGAQPILPGKAH